MIKAAFITAISLIAWTADARGGAATTTEYTKAMNYLNDRGELYFAIYPNRPADIKFLTHELSIDRIENDGKIIAYANKHEFEKFLTHGLDYEVLLPPCFQAKVTMSDYAGYIRGGRNAVAAWDKYPTYDAYCQIMEKFQTDHPQLAKLIELGPSAGGSRKVLALKVSSNVSVSHGKPRMLQVSSVHGDELLCYINTLHFIDTLLSSYGSDPRLTKFVDAIEFWFVPLLNPDGTYKGGNATVQAATRENAHGVDVNRNYPCPCGQTGAHAQYGEYFKREPEAAAIIGLYEKHYFHLALDFHGGVELALTPYGSIERKPCDEAWYTWVGKNYVDSAWKASNNNGYWKDGWIGDGSGVANIYHGLYECHGTSIDYAIFNMRARVLGMEICNLKTPPDSELTMYWNYNKSALVGLCETLLAGIQGTVKDSRTKAPLAAAQVRDMTHDFDSAYSYTDSAGFYLRFIEKGDRKLTYSKSGYLSKTLSVAVGDYAKKYPLDVELDPLGAGVVDAALQPARLCALTCRGGGIRVDFASVRPKASLEIYTANGSLVRRLDAEFVSSISWDGADGAGGNARNGCYLMKAKSGAGEACKSFILSR